ncbi:Transmembrane domain-containing protein [Orpheovirus IHUMI-LCC2]|uniref:Transmembrane domain-containing protein n=1 Tax=Orpheovirus IHUMI-LCC2 TaxID=2023057 RepID=A0A2I2L417_9VIRU|nr:Transmembrane domain-containing protein [Orpheovirus IHUMI-LCC2]SNW62292.1 Transmembrane domain-containing protein [Orpheovirus IHUMI-LCC2]
MYESILVVSLFVLIYYISTLKSNIKYIIISQLVLAGCIILGMPIPFNIIKILSAISILYCLFYVATSSKDNHKIEEDHEIHRYDYKN